MGPGSLRNKPKKIELGAKIVNKFLIENGEILLKKFLFMHT